MCGLAGLLSVRPLSRDYWQEIKASFTHRLAHRGPDSQGHFISPAQNALLVHTRLAIQDLSPLANQPMLSDDGRYALVFNGEIYNFPALRRDLEAQGIAFRSGSDTEVLLRLYEQKQLDCLDLLQGMFAFAIWDNQEQSCLIARDVSGIKPLYYVVTPTGLAFASEIKPLIYAGLTTREINPLGLYGYLLTGSVPEPLTMITGVQMLKAGTFLHWQRQGDGSPKINQGSYVNRHLGKNGLDDLSLSSSQEASALVRKSLVGAVQRHLISDVPVGLFLSGGIDSTSLLALVTQEHTAVNTYSITFDDTAYDEGTLAHLVAQQFGAQHHTLRVTPELFAAGLTQFLNAVDQPSIDGFNTYFVSRLAHENGAKVVLSGLGGDELFGSYQSFRLVPQLMHLCQRLRKGRFALQQGKKLLQASNLSHYLPSRYQRLLDLLTATQPMVYDAYRAVRGVFPMGMVHQILQHYGFDGAAVAIAYERETNQLWRSGGISGSELSSDSSLSSSPSLMEEVSTLERQHYMRNQLLRDADVMSMRWGLELRVPFLDQTFMQTVEQIPHHLRFAGHKDILTKAIPELPMQVIQQPKHGFVFPLANWLNGQWQGQMSIPHIPQVPLQSWYMKWSLFILHNWLDSLGIAAPL